MRNHVLLEDGASSNALRMKPAAVPVTGTSAPLNGAEDVRLTHVLLGAVAAAHHQCLNNLEQQLMNRTKRVDVAGPLIEGCHRS